MIGKTLTLILVVLISVIARAHEGVPPPESAKDCIKKCFDEMLACTDEGKSPDDCRLVYEQCREICVR